MYIYRLVLLLMVIIYLLSPSILDWWVSGDSSVWYKPYLFWLVTIVATLLLQGKHDVNEL